MFQLLCVDQSGLYTIRDEEAQSGCASLLDVPWSNSCSALPCHAFMGGANASYWCTPFALCWRRSVYPPTLQHFLGTDTLPARCIARSAGTICVSPMLFVFSPQVVALRAVTSDVVVTSE
eukprot:1680683-Amphidinium_carterae.1